VNETVPASVTVNGDHITGAAALEMYNDELYLNAIAQGTAAFFF